MVPASTQVPSCSSHCSARPPTNSSEAAARAASPVTETSSRALKATRALKLAGATSNAGLAIASPSGPVSMVETNRFFKVLQRCWSKPPVQQSSHRGESSAPVSHGWQTRISPDGSRRRSFNRNQSPATARSTNTSSTGMPALTNSATAWPYMGGWVIDDPVRRPHRS